MKELPGESAPSWLLGVLVVVGLASTAAATEQWSGLLDATPPAAPTADTALPERGPHSTLAAPTGPAAAPAATQTPDTAQLGEAPMQPEAKDPERAPKPEPPDQASADQASAQLPSPSPAANAPSPPSDPSPTAATPAPHDCPPLPLLRFAAEGTRPRPELRRELQPLVDWADAHPEARFVVAGHSDGGGSEYRNFVLSRKRAQAVAALLGELGLEATRLETRSFGEFEPRPDEDAHSERNRRVELSLVGRPDCLPTVEIGP